MRYLIPPVSRTRLTFSALLIVYSSCLADGQAGRAQVTGVVRDPSGAAINGARISATALDTQESETTTSNTAGAYAFPHLKPGRYAVLFEAGGFKRFQRSDLILVTGQTVRVDADLRVGNPREEVTVRGDAPLLQTESGGVRQLVDNRAILDLPLNGRSFVS